MSNQEFSHATEEEYERLPQVYRDADEDQVYPLGVKGVAERFNHALNPSFELGTEPRIGAINEITNPSFEGATVGEIEMYRNIISNPKGKTKLEDTIDVRKNLVNRSLIKGASETIVQLKADRVNLYDVATPGAFDGGTVVIPVAPNDLIHGATYTFSVNVRNPGSASIPLSIEWGTSGVPFETILEAYETKRISVSGTENLYLGSNSVATLRFQSGLRQLNFSKQLIENSGSALPFFAGDEWTGDTDLTPAWVGVEDESYSVLRGIQVKGWKGVNGVVYWSPTLGKAKLFAPFTGVAGITADSGEDVGTEPVTAMARPYTTDGTPWMTKYDGAYPYPSFQDPAGQTITELQFPVLGGTEPPTDSNVGQYWVNDQNTPYRRIQ